MEKEMYYTEYTVGPINLVCAMSSDTKPITVPDRINPASVSQIMIDTEKKDWEEYKMYISSVSYTPGDIVAIPNETLKRKCLNEMSGLIADAVFINCYDSDGNTINVLTENNGGYGVELMTS